jgi:hypothetical protein
LALRAARASAAEAGEMLVGIEADVRGSVNVDEKRRDENPMRA